HLEHQGNHHDSKAKNDIKVNISYSNMVLSVSLTDNEGKVPELELTHEKLLHLIIVSEDLNEYFHLHPAQKDNQSFEQNISLTGNSYKAFIDISPKETDYIIEALSIPIGNNIHTNRHRDTILSIDEATQKEIKGKRVELEHEPLEAGKNIELIFN